MTAGRPRAQQPATAIELVQALASDNPSGELLLLCNKWGVPMQCKMDERLESVYNEYYTARLLARHVLEYSRTQPEILPDCAGDAPDER